MFNQVIAISNDAQANDSLTTSTKQQALAFIDNIKELPPSAIWPNIKPAPFLQNIRSIIDKPVHIYAGKGTNFCGYGALSYLMLAERAFRADEEMGEVCRLRLSARLA